MHTLDRIQRMREVRQQFDDEPIKLAQRIVELEEAVSRTHAELRIDQLAALLKMRYEDEERARVFNHALRSLTAQEFEYSNWPNAILDETQCFDNAMSIAFPRRDDWNEDERTEEVADYLNDALIAYVVEYLIHMAKGE